MEGVALLIHDIDFTGYGNFQQPQQSAFNAIASLPPPQLQPQQTGTGDKFAPSNIFSAMKRQDFGKPEEQQPQDASESFSTSCFGE
jgi:hypothetical protein